MNKNLDEIKNIVKNVEGWFGDAEGEFLYNLARKCEGKGVFLEIGSWKGKSTIWLAKALKEGSSVKVYAVDPHTGSSEHKEKFGEVSTFDEFKENIKKVGVEESVVPIVKTSEDASKEWDGKGIGLLWIDGAHEYDMVKLDFESWNKYLVDGGIIAFHDTDTFDGPKKFVEQHIFTSKYFKNVGFFETITFATKVEKNNFIDRLKNRYALLIKKTYQFLRHKKFPKPRFVKNMVNRFVRGKFGA